MANTRVALVLSGAVSLGSYEGGAVTELLCGFATHNQASPQSRFIIDIIVGASAGSMTGALMAKTLLYDRTIEKAFHSAWVDEVDISKLLEPSPGQTVLSNRIVNDIAKRYLGMPEASTNPHLAWKVGPDDAEIDKETIALAFALSNLNGVEFDVETQHRTSGLGTTIFSDWVEFEIGIEKRLSKEEWENFRDAALASGAFPIAFEHKVVNRRRSDFSPGKLYDGAKDPLPTDYVDGGLFDNEPLGLALRIAKEKDSDKQDERIFILVDPYLSDLSPFGPFPKNIPLKTLFGRLVRVVLGGASQQEWVRAELADQRIQMKDQFLKYVDQIVNQTDLKSDAEIAEFRRSLSDLAKQACKRKRMPAGMSADDYFSKNLERIKNTIRQDQETFRVSHQNGLQRIESLAPIIFLVELVSGLRSRKPSKRYLIAPDPNSLAGDGVANFMGFFHRDWREHDFIKGRADTMKFLQRPEILGDQYKGDPNAKYQVDKDLSKAKVSDLSEERREEISGALNRKVEEFLKKMGFGWMKRKAIMWLVSNKVDELMNS